MRGSFFDPQDEDEERTPDPERIFWALDDDLPKDVPAKPESPPDKGFHLDCPGGRVVGPGHISDKIKRLPGDPAIDFCAEEPMKKDPRPSIHSAEILGDRTDGPDCMHGIPPGFPLFPLFFG